MRGNIRTLFNGVWMECARIWKIWRRTLHSMGKLLKNVEKMLIHMPFRVPLHSTPLQWNGMLAMMLVRWQYLQKYFQSMSLIPTHVRTPASHTHMEHFRK